MSDHDKYERFKAWIKRFHHYPVERHLENFEIYESNQKERATDALRERAKGEE